MITIKNTQRKIHLDVEHLRQDVQKLLVALNYQDFDIGIWLTTNKTIRFYNRQYRDKDKATDVLSFSYHNYLEAGKRIKVTTEEDKNLGDLIISMEYLVKEAEKYKTTLEKRLRVLVVHGICHLLGYDHIEDADYSRMRGKEAWLLKKLI
ncbi:rRNA maturation RNase YbeY [Candidatus Dependentiae bacterium]|nr:rRNA maturation RNase YbeY [Candidatus Dependentiae bacterium]